MSNLHATRRDTRVAIEQMNFLDASQRPQDIFTSATATRRTTQKPKLINRRIRGSNTH